VKSSPASEARSDARAGGSATHPAAPSHPSRLERQLEIAQQITHIGSWEWDLRTNAVSWSDELYRIYGLAPRSCEITFESFLARLHPDDRGRVQRHVQDALEHGGRFHYPERIFRDDGTMRELDTVGEAALDHDGRVVGLIGTCRDVTDERKRDEAIRLYANMVHNIQIGLCVWRIDRADDPKSATLLAFNPAAERALGMPLAARVGQSILEAFPTFAGSELPALLAAVARDGEIHDVAVYGVSDAGDRSRTLALKTFPLPGGCVGLALEDTTAQTRSRQLQAAEQRVLEMIASGEPLNEILSSLVLAIEQYSPSTIGSVLLLDADGMHVRHAAAPHLPAAYNEAIDGRPIGPAAGSCGTAAFRRRSVFVTDIEIDPLWVDYRDLARKHGLRACWSTPIVATSGRVLGTFALYYREPRSATADDLALIERATHVAGIAIERRQLEDQLRDLSAHVESVREDERTGIAREIHDELGQSLTALKMDVAWITRRVTGAADSPRDAMIDKLRTMSELTDDVINQVRRISAELRPGVLDDLGLLAAIEWQGQEFEKRTGATCAIESNVGEMQLERNLCTAVFRIFQEALTNIARHAEASHVDVRLEHREGWLHLDVHDDGKGISAEALHDPRSLGLLGMSERARRLGGTAHVIGEPGKGTTVSLAVPLTLPGALPR
jgi:PAS domain S-box-containing protein